MIRCHNHNDDNDDVSMFHSLAPYTDGGLTTANCCKVRAACGLPADTGTDVNLDNFFLKYGLQIKTAPSRPSMPASGQFVKAVRRGKGRRTFDQRSR